MITRLQQQIFGRRVPRYMIIQESPSNKRLRRRRQTVTAVLLLAAIVALMVHQVAAASVQGASDMPFEEMGMDEVAAGTLLFHTEQRGRYVPAISQLSEAEINVSGMIARVTLRQTFHNHTSDWQEGVYVFPMPDDAAVNEMRIQIGDRIIEGEIKERQAAKKIYQAAKASGKKASLVEQQRPNMFRNSVANIGPGEDIVVELVYLQTIAYDQGQFSLRFPMTITPRYIPGQVNRIGSTEIAAVGEPVQIDPAHGWAQSTTQVPDAELITPPQMPDDTRWNRGNRIRISGRVNVGMPLHGITSSYHPLDLNRSEQVYDFELAGGEVEMNQDFVLNWQPHVGQEPEAAVFTERVGNDSYALLMLMPPQASGHTGITLPKEQIFIIDTSGSMGGVSIQQAKASLELALDRLNPGDRFNVIEFNSVVRPFFERAVDVSNDSIAKARSLVEQLKANGGTEMLPALHSAMPTKQADPDSQRIRQIVFITDGSVGNEEALFRAIKQRLGDSRLFTVGIGSAPNSHFMRKAAQFGRGTFTHIGQLSEVRVKMDALFTKLGSPIARNLTVAWPTGIEADNAPHTLPDLYAGEPIVVGTRLKNVDITSVDLSVVINGEIEDQQWERYLNVSAGKAEHKGVGTLWARRTIDSLMDKRSSGLPENALRDAVLEIALPHKLLTKFTAFVAVEQERSRPETEALKTNKLANAKPKSQAAQKYAYPKGSTSARISLIWASLLMMVFVLLRRCMNIESMGFASSVAGGKGAKHV